jgi:hypothetical protein
MDMCRRPSGWSDAAASSGLAHPLVVSQRPSFGTEEKTPETIESKRNSGKVNEKSTDPAHLGTSDRIL